MKRKITLILPVVLVFGLLLSACNLFGAAEPTPDPLALQQTVNAAVAQQMQTIAAEQTSTAAALPTATFTPEPTLEPTATNTPPIPPTVSIPTSTKPPATVAPTITKTATPAPYACQLVSTSPTSGTKLALNSDFDGRWVVKNVGTKAWEVGYMDLKYVSGTKMQTVADVFDINTYVAIGGTLDLIVDMKVPSSTGKYTATWALMMEGITMCTLPVNIEAVTP